MNCFIKINNHKIILLAIAIQIALFGSLMLDFLGLKVLLLRESVGLIYLTFIPGLLIIRVFKLRSVDFTECFLFAVGISISLIYFIGFFINLFLPSIDVKNPLSIYPLAIMLFFVTLSLCAILYLQDELYKEILLPVRLSNISLLFILLPFLSIFSIYLMSFYALNFFVIVTLSIISLIPIFLISYHTDESFYPFVIFLTAISIVYHKSLNTPYIFGTDIFREYAFSAQVIRQSIWDPYTSGPLSGMLSIVLLAPIYNILTGISLVWLYKAFYPFLFSLVAVGLYKVIEKQTYSKFALLSTFLFIFGSPFYGVILEAARQQIAELFLVLLLLVVINNKIYGLQKKSLLIIFMLSLVTSHYGITYLFLLAVCVLSTLSLVFRYIKPISDILHNYTSISTARFFSFSNYYLLLFSVFALSWYIFISQSINFNTIVSIFAAIAGDLGEVLNPNQVDGLRIITGNYSLSRQLTIYLYLLSQFGILVGIATYLFKRSQISLCDDYFSLAIFYFMILIISIIVPNTSASMGTSRIYHICLLLLSPFFILGFSSFCSFLKNLFNKLNILENKQINMCAIAIFLCVFFLFDSGVICEIIKDDPPNSLSLNSTIIWPPHFSDADISGCMWLKSIDSKNNIYSDKYTSFLLDSIFVGNYSLKMYNSNMTAVLPHSNILLTKLNTNMDRILEMNYLGTWMSIPSYKTFSKAKFVDSVINKGIKLYSNGNVIIYSNDVFEKPP